MMEVITNENTVFFDVDGTLIDTITKVFNNGDTIHTNQPILGNIDQIHRHKARGFYIVVWSANGYQHAANIVKELGLELVVDLVMTKPHAYFDDKHIDEWANKVFVGD